MSTKQSSIPIALAVRSLRQELLQALKDGDGQDIRFELGTVEIEFQVEVSWDTKAKGSGKSGINFGVITLGEVSGEFEANRKKGRTHTVKLVLNPVDSEGDDVVLSAKDSKARPA